MSNGFINTSRIRPCPICGKTDWCGFKQIDGGELVVCMRDTTRDDVIGHDGQSYTFISDKTGNSIYELTSQREDRIKGWKANNAPTKHSQLRPVVYENVVKPLPNDMLDSMYRDLLKMLYLERNHILYLEKEGWNKSLIDKHLIRSFPENSFYRYQNRGIYTTHNLSREDIAKELLIKYGDLTGLPGAYKNKKGVWTFAGLGGITFPIYDAYGRIIRLRIRVDRQYFDGNGNDISKDRFLQLKDHDEPCRDVGKYHNFSSFSSDPEKAKLSIVANRYDCGCEAGNHIGYYFNEDEDDFYICYVTEGEKKSIIGNSILHAPIIHVPGVNSFGKLLNEDETGKRPVDYMKDLGIHLVIMAFDADKKYNEKVYDSEQRTIEILKKEGFQIAVANWDESLGKGLDDLLVAGYRPEYTLVK